MKSYSLRFTEAEWRLVEDGLRSVPGEASAAVLWRLSIAREALASLQDAVKVAEANGNGGTVSPLAHNLSQREVCIIRALTEGASNKVIARRLVITESTVKVHMKAILRKLALRNRTQAAVWARQHLTA